MPVVIRLKRAGGRNRPFFRLVVSDSRMPRDGRFIEALGYYDPLSDPAKIQIDREKVAAWVSRGAQPSDTVRQLLKKDEGTEGAGAGMATGES